jgi:3-oxoacyl-[acyl-carrier protein] reductase
MSLESKVAVVTGGGAGIGNAICRRLAAEGARVAVLDIDEQAAGATADEFGGVAIHADVSDGAAVERARADAEAELGPIDIWVNNAGLASRAQAERVNPRAEQQLAEAAAGGPIRTALDALVRLPDEEWHRMLAVHLDGTFFGTRAAARSMAGRGGVVVNIASICGIEGCTGYPHYSAAKGGILAFTRAVAKELIVQGIRVNAIAPGFVETQSSTTQSDALRRALELRLPIGRYATPEEIAATVAFLASDDAAFFVGETLTPSGGAITI